ncbi:MAG TPA: YraN family protein [Acidimicrobiia bacterium]|jgi:Holliday junction resolvase-like predicted endonuclease
MDWVACRELSTAALGRLAEETACRFLRTKGISVSARNVVLDAGEIDIIAPIRGERTLVEVRSTRTRPGAGWPAPQALAAFDLQKAEQVRRLARISRCARIDVIAVRFHEVGIDLHWVPRAV